MISYTSEMNSAKKLEKVKTIEYIRIKTMKYIRNHEMEIRKCYM